MSEERAKYTYQDELAALGKLIRAAHGLDTSWMPAGTCRDYPAARNDSGWTWWMADIYEPGGNLTAKQKLETAKGEMALLICHSCPAQYDCAIYGAKSLAQGSIWGVRTNNMRWLQGDLSRAVELIEQARTQGVAVEVHVNRHRAALANA